MAPARVVMIRADFPEPIIPATPQLVAKSRPVTRLARVSRAMGTPGEVVGGAVGEQRPGWDGAGQRALVGDPEVEDAGGGLRGSVGQTSTGRRGGCWAEDVFASVEHVDGDAFGGAGTGQCQPRPSWTGGRIQRGAQPCLNLVLRAGRGEVA
ncbi:hypothetical protein DMP14_06115 [Pseudonocardia sp. Ae707_Ps2]